MAPECFPEASVSGASAFLSLVAFFAACVLMLVAAPAQAQTPAGTVITNQAGASGTQGGSPIGGVSNAVSLTVGGGAAAGFSALLRQTTLVDSQPGATVYVAHTLTNTGTAADTYTIAAVDAANGVYRFASVTLFPDADFDGRPDGATPLANPIALAPGQMFGFVVRIVIPANAPFGQNDARVSAASAGGASIAPNIDRVTLNDYSIVRDCGIVTKVLSRDRGPSPASGVKVTLRYDACDKPRSRLVLFDTLPAGMRYVAGSGRWSATGALALTDGVAGNDRQGTPPAQLAYDWNVSNAGAVTATVFDIPAGGFGTITFDVDIDGGIATGTLIPNSARYSFYDTNGAPFNNDAPTNVATYLVTGSASFDLRGQRLPTATPGTTVTFTNVLRNLGDAADTFDITLSGSTFPPGTTFALFRPDGVTPLADTDGSGTPDTGVVAAGASYNIVVRVAIPANAPPASYKVTKTARSAATQRTASDDDVVDTIAEKCATTLDPDNNAQVGFGQHVTYTHWLTNRGNCTEVVRATLEYLVNSRALWTATVHVDNPVAGGGSLPGAVDRTDTRIEPGWSAALRPGETLRILVDVLAPTREAMVAAAARAKQVVDTNLTTLVISSTSGGPLTVRDTTIIDDKEGATQPSNVIRNFVDSSYTAPTIWGVIGGSLWLRADAPSCNASATTAETRTVVLTGPQGEREELVATETGPDTGIFLVPVLAVRAPPVTAGDGIVQGRPNDVFDFEILGCGRRIANVVTLMQPASVVFDSATNDPVPGARVTLVAAPGGRCGPSAIPLSGAANPATTDAEGRFAFPSLPAADYCLVVAPPNGYRFPSTVPWPRLPAGRNLHVTGATSGGSYGSAFASAAGGFVVVDVPVDPAAQDGLFVQKDVSRAIAEIGEFVDYTVRVRNGTGNALDRADVMLADDLPAGFSYVPGSARRDGVAIADPAGGRGPRLTLALGRMARGEQVTVTYRVRIGPAALQGDGVNRVRASYTANGSTTLSNMAAARVQVTRGVFTDKGFILGKVFLDCNANGMQDAGERGVPGVRVLIEDGTYVITDGGGKFSFYGVSAHTHVVKVDRTTLPAGARLGTTSHRNLGDPGSRMVDLKNGELGRADFAIAGCDAAVVDEVAKRAQAQAKQDEIAAMVGAQLATEARVITDVKALPAAGVVAIQPAPAAAGTTPATATPPSTPFTPVAPAATTTMPKPVAPVAGGVFSLEPAPAAGARPLEQVILDADNALAFLGLADGQTLGYAQMNVRVKGTAGATLRLRVNGREIPAARIGKRSVLEDKQLQAVEYIGVDLKPGANTLTVEQVDQFGNPRGSQSIKVVAPGRLGRIEIEVPAAGGIADGRTPAKVVVKLADEDGVPVTVRTPVTLDASLGKWTAQDLDPAQPGLQVFVEDGRGEFGLVGPLEPASAQIVAIAGTRRTEARLDFLPELRSLVGAGVIEGIVNMRNVNTRALVPARAADGFEQELRHLSREWNDGKTDAGVRAAFYLKGKIRGEYLLTAAYDSDKDTKERLFRDIQPDEFYPIYGDSGTRGFDAQSTSRLYVRIDHRRSYLLWGDFTTQSTGEARKLANYSRSLTGAKHHFENERMSVNVFASRDTSRQVIEELRANGTSGPYQLGTHGALVNSEKVEIVTRDRSQPALIVASVPQARFADYEIEALTGRILFKAPVPSVDRDLNPVFVRVTYEVDQGGEAFWVAGIDAQVKLGERVEVGGIYVKDKNPLLPFTLAGVHTVVKLGSNTYVIAEAAQTERGLDNAKGEAGRVEFKHDSKSLKVHAFVAKSDREFDNPGAYLTQGRGEAGGKLEYRLSDRTTLRAEALRTEDTNTHAVRDGLAAAVQHQLADRLTLELGVRHARESGAASPVPAIPAAGGGTLQPVPMPDEVTTVRARVTGAVPGVEGATVYGEVEVDVKDADRRILAAGGEYRLPNKGRVYARHEFISSITGPYGLNPQERQNTTAIGIDTEYMKDGRLFSEYRIRDAISGGDAEAAIGLRNLWSVAPGWKLGTTFERVQAISGTGQNENTAAAFALEYTGSPVWKGSTRLELRDGATQDTLLFTVGLAARLAKDWTLLARNAYSVTRNQGAGDQVIERMQAGVAYRDSDTNLWNALARVEHRLEKNDSTPGASLRSSTQIFSLHADWHPVRPFVLTGRYAAKWSSDHSNGLASRYRAQAFGARGTWEFAPKWDVGLVTSLITGAGTASRQYGVGLELGYLLATNLWVSAGYNFFGYRDADLAGADYTAKGPYIRLRYKFDETLFEGAPHARAGDNKNMATSTTAEGAR